MLLVLPLATLRLWPAHLGPVRRGRRLLLLPRLLGGVLAHVVRGHAVDLDVDQAALHERERRLDAEELVRREVVQRL